MTRIGISLIFMLLLAACGAGASPEAPTMVPTVPTRTPVPTYTPTLLPTTPLSETPATESIAVAAPEPTAPGAVPLLLPTVTLAPATPTPEVSSAPAGDPLLTVAQDAVNVRSGPGVDYLLAGLVVRGATYPIIGRNAAGDWWQVCCVDGQPGWIFGTLATVANADAVTVVADIAPPSVAVAPAATAAPAAGTTTEAPPTPEDAPLQVEAPPLVEAPPPVEEPPPPVDSGGTAGNFDPNAQYQIVHYRVLGFDDNNGGIFNKGGQQLIFLTVLDQNGAPVDGAVVRDAVGDKLNVVTGSKGSGKAEIKMDWDPYKLFVASDSSGAVTSQVSNQLNNPYPHLPDVIGKLGALDNEYAVCPTPEINCTPPFFTIHFSYEITFQRVK